MLESLRENIPNIIFAFVLLCLTYLCVAGLVFQVRNPMATQVAFWLHIDSVLKFEKLPQFQEPVANK